MRRKRRVLWWARPSVGTGLAGCWIYYATIRLDDADKWGSVLSTVLGAISVVLGATSVLLGIRALAVARHPHTGADAVRQQAALVAAVMEELKALRSLPPPPGSAARSVPPTRQTPAARTAASDEPAHPAAAIRAASAAAPGSPFPTADVSPAAPPPATVTLPAVSRAYASPGLLGRGLRALDRMRTRRSGHLARELLRMAMPMLEERIIRRTRPGSPVATFAAARHAGWCATTRRSVKQIRREAR